MKLEIPEENRKRLQKFREELASAIEGVKATIADVEKRRAEQESFIEKISAELTELEKRHHSDEPAIERTLLLREQKQRAEAELRSYDKEIQAAWDKMGGIAWQSAEVIERELNPAVDAFESKVRSLLIELFDSDQRIGYEVQDTAHLPALRRLLNLQLRREPDLSSEDGARRRLELIDKMLAGERFWKPVRV